MTLILQTKDRFIKMYRISWNSNTIVGWFNGRWLQTLLSLPDNHNSDYHFTFPIDGNYHFSYKSINSEKEEYITVYWNNVKIKTILNGQKTIIKQSRQEFEEQNPLLTTLVPMYKPKSLTEISSFQFPTICFNIFEGTFKKRASDNLINESKIHNEDLVINISGFDNVNIAIYAEIVSDKNQFTFKDTLHQYSKSIEISNGRRLQLVCNIFPM